MPASMSSAAPTPSPSAKHASLTSWQTIRPSTRPGASPTHSTWRPSEAKKPSAARAAASEVVGLRVSSTSPPSGTVAKKPAALPSGSSSASGASSHSTSCGPPCSVTSLSPPPQSTISAGTSPLDVLRVGDPPARLARGVGQRLGQRREAGDHDEPAVAAAGLRRRRVLGAVRLVAGVLVPAAAGLAAEAPRRRLARGERRRAPARLAEGLVVERLRDLEADVDADEVHQLERAHPEAAAEAADAVDLLVASPAPPARAAAPPARTAACSG